LEILKKLANEEGFGTLYRGLIPVLESLCISNFIYFYTFHSLKALYNTKKSAFNDLLLGIIAGFANVLLTTPFWVVNTRLKMQGINNNEKQNFTNLIDGLIYIAKNEGIKKLWSGVSPSLILVLNPALQFMTYESLKRKLIKSNNTGGLAYFSIGAIAKTIAAVLTYPLQLIQTKLRHGKQGDIQKNAGMIQLLMMIVKREGVIGLYRGMESKIIQTVMTAALMFATYEKIVKFVMSLLLSQHRIKHK